MNESKFKELMHWKYFVSLMLFIGVIAWLFPDVYGHVPSWDLFGLEFFKETFFYFLNSIVAHYWQLDIIIFFTCVIYLFEKVFGVALVFSLYFANLIIVYILAVLFSQFWYEIVPIPSFGWMIMAMVWFLYLSCFKFIEPKFLRWWILWVIFFIPLVVGWSYDFPDRHRAMIISIFVWFGFYYYWPKKYSLEFLNHKLTNR